MEAKCRNFVRGNCILADDTCWFLHYRENGNDKFFEDESESREEDFRLAEEKVPPDQMNKINKLLNKLTMQVEILEKKSLN